MKFQVASNPGHYSDVHTLMRREGILKTSLSFPTLMALEDKTLVGALGTHIEKRMIVAGPLVMRSDRQRAFTALRMIEMYIAAMKGMGISSFIFYGETDGLLTRAVERYYPNMTPYAIRDGNNFYIWRM